MFQYRSRPLERDHILTVVSHKKMKKTDFYVTELTGDKRWLTYEEIHKVRKDILLYFDDNIGETVTVLMPLGEFNLDYWKYLSIGFDKEWAESERYKRLIEEGCLALLNAITLEILEEPINGIIKEWRKISVDAIIPYINQYEPKTDKLKTAKSHLQRTFGFIKNLDYSDLDEYAMLKEFDLSLAGEWFDLNIVQDYYQWNLERYGSKQGV